MHHSLNSKLIFSIFFVSEILMLAIAPGLAFAQTNFRQGQSVTLSQTEVINDNYFAAGQMVDVAGTVNGDTYLAGGNIIVDGTVNGDLLVAGGSVDIRGKVLGNVRSVSGQINISGSVGKNITAVGGQITILDTAKIGGSLTAAGGNITVSAPLGRNLQVSGGQLTITNTIPGDVVFSGGTVTFTNTARVGGQVTYYSDQPAVLQPGASVSGQLVHLQLPRSPQPAAATSRHIISSVFTVWTGISFVSNLVLGLLIVNLAKNLVTRTSQRIQSKFWSGLGIGFLILIAVPAVVLILLITVIGIPLAMILTVSYLLWLFVSRLFAAVYIGRLITTRLSDSKSLVGAFIVGLIIYYVLGFIPVIGWLARLVILLAAAGALFLESRDIHTALAQKKLL
jgi:hypothetical protein